MATQTQAHTKVSPLNKAREVYRDILSWVREHKHVEYVHEYGVYACFILTHEQVNIHVRIRGTRVVASWGGKVVEDGVGLALRKLLD